MFCLKRRNYDIFMCILLWCNVIFQEMTAYKKKNNPALQAPVPEPEEEEEGDEDADDDDDE